MILILAAAAANPAPGTAFRDLPYAPIMIAVPPGKAMLGSDQAEQVREGRPAAAAAMESPRRLVVLPTAFAIGKYHVTRREYHAFVKATKRAVDGCVVALNGKWSEGPLPGYNYRRVGFAQRPDEPALCVNWNDAQAYAAWLSVRTGQSYRLPNEAEWEYSARAGTVTARWWGDGRHGLCQKANGGDRAYASVMPDDETANTTCSDGFAYTNPGDRFPANPFGLHDMLGNAWQWLAECYSAVPGSVLSDLACKARSISGGSWHNGPAVLRSATRFGLPPEMRSSSLGFRVLRDLN